MPDQMGYFASLKSAAGKVFTYLASITLTGTDGKKITVEDDSLVNQDLTTDASPTFVAAKESTARIEYYSGQEFSPPPNIFSPWEDNRSGDMNGDNGIAYCPIKARVGEIIKSISVYWYINGGTGTFKLDLCTYSLIAPDAPTVVSTTTSGAGVAGDVVISPNYTVISSLVPVIRVTTALINAASRCYTFRVLIEHA